MISKVSIRNFKSLRDVQIDLERFTVFVGPNASGKSSILQAMDWLCRTFHFDHPQNLESDLLRSLSRGATEQIELAGEASGKAYRYRTRSPSTSLAPSHVAQTNWTGEGRGVASSLAASDWKPWKPDRVNAAPLPQSVVIRLETPKLIQPNPTPSDPTVMAPDGAGLHSALASMALNDPDSWQELQANLRQIIPTIRRLRHSKTSNVQEPIALLFDTVGADSIPANQMSAGTLFVLGLLAVLHAPSRPDLVLLDDLDHGIHPKAQKELIGFLRGLLKKDANLQILTTTHSPYMLDSMETNEVRLTFQRDDGATVCAALANHPKFPKWKDEMTPGELWSLFGEKWLVEEGAAA